MDHDDDAADEERQITEDYKVWKKNTPFLYDLVLSHSLEWPSLTVQWLPDLREDVATGCSVQRLILGTHTSDAEQNYLLIAETHLPLSSVPVDASKYDESKNEVAGFGSTLSKIKVNQRIPHDGEVNRARYMPQNPNIIATKTPAAEGAVFVFDITKHRSSPEPGAKCAPELRLLGHRKEGYGLAWSLLNQGHLLSSSDDGSVCHWDIQGASRDANTLQPLHTYRPDGAVVEDVAWHPHSATRFGTCGDDKRFHLFDTRTPDEATHVVNNAHDGEVNCMAFNPYSEYLLITGSADKHLKLWDIRNLSTSLHTMRGHTDEIFQVVWAPFNEYTVASSGTDRRVLVWDLSRIGDDQMPDDQNDGDPELLFIHGGHTSKVSDISWNPNTPWVLASTAEDNILMVWQMAETIYAPDNAAALDASAMSSSSSSSMQA